jgi:hypothetical protein
VRRLFVLLLTLALVAPAAALAGTNYTLHPSGFGEHSYSAWKGGEGLPDSTGSANQALYFQKMTATTTFAAGVAVIKGFEGQPVSTLKRLEFYWRTDGHCGAGAPRFDVFYQPALGPQQTLFIGCQGMTPGATVPAPNGTTYQQRTYSGPFPTGVLDGPITGIAIVFDEGSDVGPGFVYLDDITVESETASHTWTSASDNGNANNQTITQDPTGSVYLSALLGQPITAL